MPYQASERRPALAFTPADPSVWDRFQRMTPILSTFLNLHLSSALKNLHPVLLPKIRPLDFLICQVDIIIPILKYSDEDSIRYYL